MPKPFIRWSKPNKPSLKQYRHSPKRIPGGPPPKPNMPHFGKYAIQAVEAAWMTSRQIERVRRILATSTERRAKIFIRIFPHQVITQRIAESRAGAGKGKIEYWVAAVRPDCVLFELDGVSEEIAYNAFRAASHRLPCKVRFMKRPDQPSEFELEGQTA